MTAQAARGGGGGPAASRGRWARPAHVWRVPLLLEHLVDEPVELRLLRPGRVNG